ncbi:MAG TPA: type II secretion system minor pseudopilin GspH [Woeseiaceae bacterium]|nr:type II secretion system minor pseudopilin GspH [Woeseiaceae bacterium]
MRIARRRSGFTLIEVLVVVVIIGIVSSVVLLSLGVLGDDRGLRQEARRMASLLDLAADEAVLQGRDFGIEFTQAGYRFVEHDPYLDRWHEVVGDDILRQRHLPEAMHFDLYIEDRRVTLKDDPARLASEDSDERGDAPTDYAPHVLLLSSGEVSPLHIEIRRDTDRRVVAVDVDPVGTIEISDDDDQTG